MSRSADLLRGLALAVCLTLPAAAGDPPKVGRLALPEEIAAWDVDVRPDGHGLPPGAGAARAGETLYLERCASCHGEFGEGAGRWPVLAGGHGSLAKEGPEKTIGSFWPYASTVYDYVRRTMPFTEPGTLTPEQTYALTAYLLTLNDVADDSLALSRENFGKIRLPNEATFRDDDRETAERAFWNRQPCMTDCAVGVAVKSRARALDVTPEDEGAAARGGGVQ